LSLEKKIKKAVAGTIREDSFTQIGVFSWMKDFQAQNKTGIQLKFLFIDVFQVKKGMKYEKLEKLNFQ